MGVRKIRPNPLVPHGFIASAKNGCMSPNESNLERDFAKLLEFDRGVASYEAQPLELSFLDRNGRQQPGWPDFLVNFVPVSGRRPELVDVKYRSEIFKKWPTLKPRFKAARVYATEHGWSYKIWTEAEIRTPRLLAVTFLLTFRHMVANHEDVDSILVALESGAKTTPARLLKRLSGDKWRQAELLASLWHLVANFRVEVDLEHPVHMNSRIWVRRQLPNAG